MLVYKVFTEILIIVCRDIFEWLFSKLKTLHVYLTEDHEIASSESEKKILVEPTTWAQSQ